ncbi:MAG TPA: segregation/condensation protein A [Opitutaceae bacterium]|nr:segregation/condensation protein A [Opitutaceae bacterium]
MVAPIPDTDYRIKLQVFEGPLDLLLFLIRKNELDIYDIPIEQVTKQYLEALYAMGELKLELAGEFFVMAATLMEIKSRMLLPKHQQAVDPEAEEDEELDPRWELVHQLIQYKKFKDAAAGIAEMIGTRQAMLERAQVQQNLAANDRPLRPSDRIELWNAFNQVLRRLAEKLVVGDIKDDNLTVVDQMEMILKRIAFEPRFTFSSLLPGKTSLRNLVATFIAVLELTRMLKIRVQQDKHFEDITIERREPEAQPAKEGELQFGAAQAAVATTEAVAPAIAENAPASAAPLPAAAIAAAEPEAVAPETVASAAPAETLSAAAPAMPAASTDTVSAAPAEPAEPPAASPDSAVAPLANPPAPGSLPA